MNGPHKVSCAVAWIMILILSHGSPAQVRLSRSVLAGGATLTASPNHRISATVGQPVIGVSKNSLDAASLGFWTAHGKSPVRVRLLSSTVSEIQLDEVYPNPVTPSTECEIRFAVASSGHVRLTIVNMQGQSVVTLMDEQILGGRYTLRFDPSMLPSGTYFAVLQSGVRHRVKKLLLVR